MAEDQALSFATVILAGRALPGDRDRVTEMVASARALGAVAIVVAVPRGWRAPSHGRVVHVAPGGSSISAMRLAMAQLSNTPARYALLLPLGATPTAMERLRELVDVVARERPAIASFEGEDPDDAPSMVARDAWLDLMTIGEQGMSALGERLRIRLLAARSTDVN